MSVTAARVDRYCLTVDAADTLRAVLDSADTPWGRRLDNALRTATYYGSVYAVDPWAPVTLQDFAPGPHNGPDRPDVAAPTVGRVLDGLRDAGYLTTHDVWSETSGAAYLNEARCLTAVQVLRPFVLVAVEYGWTHGALLGYADRWAISERTYIVPAGGYLIAETCDWETRLVGVAGLTFDHAEDLACRVAEIEGFGASRASAGCDTCDRTWFADSGSWHFTPDSDSGDAVASGWDYDDAEDFDGDTVACPGDCPGRVGFLIY